MRKAALLTAIALVLLAAVLIWAGWGKGRHSTSSNAAFDGRRAYAWVTAQCDLGPRPTGSEAHRKLKQLIRTALREDGWQVETQTFSHQGLEVENITGKAGGAGRPIIIGAHYDTRPQADRDPDNPTAPIPGANDGASGTAVLLELARALQPVKQPVWLVFFDAEDRGEIAGWDWSVGARYYAQHLDAEPQAVVVVDMIGDADLQIYLETNSTPALCQEIWSTAAELGYTDTFIPHTRWSIIDDHLPFRERGWPACLLIDFDYPYWHTQADTPDKVSPESLQRVGAVLEKWVEKRSGP